MFGFERDVYALDKHAVGDYSQQNQHACPDTGHPIAHDVVGFIAAFEMELALLRVESIRDLDHMVAFRQTLTLPRSEPNV